MKDKARDISVADDGLGKRWFMFWTYVCYPVSFAVFLFLAVATAKPYFWVFVLLILLITTGLHNRRLWGYQLNLILIVANFGALFLPAIRESTPTDSWVLQLVVGGVFVAANIAYWQKRKSWFSGSDFWQ
jgi:hypothetical protein